MVADRDVRERWPRDPDGVPLYPGAARQMRDEDRAGRASPPATPYAIRLDMARRHGMGRAAALVRDRRGPARRDRRGRRPIPRPGAMSSSGRKETPTSYHLSVVLDDALQGVTHVVRGQDLFWSTACIACCSRCSICRRRVYHHHRLILDADGRKLSKSTQATGLRELRAQGATPADIRRLVGSAHSGAICGGVPC